MRSFGEEFSGKIGNAVDLSHMLNERDKQAAIAEIKAFQLKVGSMVDAIEKVLLDGGATWEHWVAIVGAYNDRNNMVINNLPMKEIKEKFDNSQK